MKHGTSEYYRSVAKCARELCFAGEFETADVEGATLAADMLKSVEDGDMTAVEALEYVNDKSFDDQAGIAWARRAIKFLPLHHRTNNLHSNPARERES